MHCIEQGYLTISEFNGQMMFFDFGHSESSKKPTPTDDSVVKRGGGNIRQSASQRWSYTRMSPLLVGIKCL